MRQHDAVRNGMCGVLFTACTHGKEFVFRVFTGGNNLLKLEVAFCDSAGLIHDHSAELLNPSMERPPLKRMPFLEPAPIPEKKASGILSTRAQGQLITRKVIAV